PRHTSTGRTSRIPKKQFMCRPYCYPAYNHRTVYGMAVPTARNLRRLREGVRQRRQRDNLKAATTLRDHCRVCPPYQAAVRKLLMPSRP
ncbi:hypothetical protein, partial [Acinetobacter baumannii]|uniref:hypothetical protein n=1 Tax=Acinetobacter baumannii TaxID=470 RepID=UPI003390AD0C